MIDKKEVDFIHALATPLGTVMYICDELMERMRERKVPDEDIHLVEDALSAIQKIRGLINERKETLIQGASK